MNPPPPAALHLRSDFSLLRAAWSVGVMASALGPAGYGTGMLADWNSLSGAVAFWKEMRKNGLRPLLGCELETRHGPASGSILLAVTNNSGYQSLCRILTRRTKGPPPGLEDLAGRVEGLAALTSGKEGMLHRLLQAGRSVEANRWLNQLRSTFGEDSTFLQVLGQHPSDSLRAALFLDIAEELALPVVAAMEFRYAKPEDAELLRAVTSIGTLTLLDETADGKPENPTGFHLRPAAEWAECSSAFPGAVERASTLAASWSLPLFDESLANAGG